MQKAAVTRPHRALVPERNTPPCHRPSPVPQADQPFDEVQFTLVDCPGHASLIRTIIGGAQIIDMMMLVVDVTKGIQTQTAECLVVGELTTPNLVLVLNKTDMLPQDGREARGGAGGSLRCVWSCTVICTKLSLISPKRNGGLMRL